MNKRKNLLAAAVAASSLLGLASVAQATPAVVAGASVGTAPAVVATPGTYSSGTTIMTVPETTITVASAPPTPVYEAVPAPRHGYVWAPGHYEWRHGRYVWMGGSWLAQRPGYAWQAARWEQRPDGSWILVGGNWVRSDRVAVYENGHRVYRDRAMGDRDGDGVPNRYDAHPNNPNRD